MILLLPFYLLWLLLRVAAVAVQYSVMGIVALVTLLVGLWRDHRAAREPEATE